MFNFLFNSCKLLIYSSIISLKYKYRNNISNKDLVIFNKYINNCGCIMTKCIQWLIPLLDNGTLNDNILYILNNVYENNKIHNINYTEKLYIKSFKYNLYDKYDIINIIGSGSIGQVYKIKCKKTDKFYVMKVKHPDIEKQILIFRKIFYIIYNVKIFNSFFYNYFPFNLVKFLDDFYKQNDFINECNNLLKFHDYYINNEYIIIPKLISASKDIIIMENIEGECIDNLNISEYKKSKIIYLLYLFVRNNLLINNNNHGDLHKHNWKVSSDKLNNLHKIIIYDFGYCFKLDHEEYKNINILCDIIVSIDDKNTQLKYEDFLKFTLGDVKLDLNVVFNNKITEPAILLKQVLQISKRNNIIIHRYKLLNSILLMSLVDNYFKKYNINNNNNKYTVKKNILDAYSFCNTYNIFPKLAKHLYYEYNLNNEYPKQSIIFSDKIKSLI